MGVVRPYHQRAGDEQQPGRGQHGGAGTRGRRHGDHPERLRDRLTSANGAAGVDFEAGYSGRRATTAHPRLAGRPCAGAAAVVTCLALGWWQAGRAAGGNTFSWAYTFEWPIFAIFVVVIWVREIRLTLRKGRAEAPAVDPVDRPRPVITRRVNQPTAAAADKGDPQLAEYNRYLAWLNENPKARPSDYPAKEYR